MPNEETKATPSQPEASVPPGDPPKLDILGQVQYAYSSIAQIAVGAADVRIAFGDQIPPDGKIQPLFGVTLLPDHAARLAMMLLAQIHSSPHGKRLTANIPVMPKEMAGAKNWKILKSDGGEVIGVHMVLHDGTERTIAEDALTPDAKKFLTQMAAIEKMAPIPPPKA